MTIDGKEINAVVFYDTDTMEICAVIEDDETVIPENCEVAFFPEGTMPWYGENDEGTKFMRGAIVQRGTLFGKE